MSDVTTDNKETLGFQAEVKQLLHLMIHALYSNKEIFLRELVSNASDACDKLRFEAMDKAELFEGDGELKIRVDLDAEARTISICDNGIGLSRDEAILHLGTIAKSGTKEFFASLTGDRSKDSHLIGQFGVGFYSSFIVADRVTVESRRAGLPTSEGVRWSCAMEGDTAGAYSVETIEKQGRGTTVTLHLREGEDEFASAWKLRQIITRYSDHITLPIQMQKEEWDEEKKQMVARDELETVNQANALWARSKSDIDDEQYKAFYKHVAHDFEDPLAWVHARVEGRHEYTQLLYIPTRAPFDLFDRQARHGVKLYVKRVFIMDDAEQLMPLYLRFVRGIVDTNDLPLNVSREILQQSKDIEAIRGGCVKKVLGLLSDLAESDKERYATFWSTFGAVLKEGVGEDHANKEKIASLLRFATTQADTPEEIVSLDDYLGRMKEGQDKIYYVTAETFTAARNSPHLEIFRKKGIEVLLLSERVDEWVVGSLQEYQGKALVSVAKGAVDLGELEDDTEKAEREQAAEANKALVERITTSLGERVKSVRVTNRLTDSPACLVSDEYDMGGNMARILKSVGQKAPEVKPILEINPLHPVVRRLDAESERFDDWVAVLFDQALLAEGGTLEDPAGFVRRVNGLMMAMSGSKG